MLKEIFEIFFKCEDKYRYGCKNRSRCIYSHKKCKKCSVMTRNPKHLNYLVASENITNGGGTPEEETDCMY